MLNTGWVQSVVHNTSNDPLLTNEQISTNNESCKLRNTSRSLMATPTIS